MRPESMPHKCVFDVFMCVCVCIVPECCSSARTPEENAYGWLWFSGWGCMVVGGLCTTLLGECKVADISAVEGGRAGGRSVGGSGAPLGGGGVGGRVPAANIILTLICARNVHARVRLNVPSSMHDAAGHRRRAVGSEHVCAIAFLPRLNRLTVMRADCKPLHSTVSCCALNIDDDKRRRRRRRV